MMGKMIPLFKNFIRAASIIRVRNSIKAGDSSPAAE
jgi:hypothetical protein